MKVVYIQDWYVHAETSEKHIQNSFVLAMLENMTEKEFLFFPVWNNHHFFLIVGRVGVRKWEYYNSLNREGDYTFAVRYVSTIKSRLTIKTVIQPLFFLHI